MGATSFFFQLLPLAGSNDYSNHKLCGASLRHQVSPQGIQ